MSLEFRCARYLSINIGKAKTNVIKFAHITAALFMSTPYTNHISSPVTNMRYIVREIPLVSCVLITLIAWGKKESVVRQAAKYPIADADSISYSLL